MIRKLDPKTDSAQIAEIMTAMIDNLDKSMPGAVDAIAQRVWTKADVETFVAGIEDTCWVDERKGVIYSAMLGSVEMMTRKGVTSPWYLIRWAPTRYGDIEDVDKTKAVQYPIREALPYLVDVYSVVGSVLTLPVEAESLINHLLAEWPRVEREDRPGKDKYSPQSYVTLWFPVSGTWREELLERTAEEPRTKGKNNVRNR